MGQAAGQVLKAKSVTMQGQFRLESDAAAARPVPVAVPKPAAVAVPTAPAGVPQVRIVENAGDYAVLEVTCPCGETTLVRCAFPATT